MLKSLWIIEQNIIRKYHLLAIPEEYRMAKALNMNYTQGSNFASLALIRVEKYEKKSVFHKIHLLLLSFTSNMFPKKSPFSFFFTFLVDRTNFLFFSLLADHQSWYPGRHAHHQRSLRPRIPESCWRIVSRARGSHCEGELIHCQKSIRVLCIYKEIRCLPKLLPDRVKKWALNGCPNK